MASVEDSNALAATAELGVDQEGATCSFCDVDAGKGEGGRGSRGRGGRGNASHDGEDSGKGLWGVHFEMNVGCFWYWVFNVGDDEIWFGGENEKQSARGIYVLFILSIMDSFVLTCSIKKGYI